MVRGFIGWESLEDKEVGAVAFALFVGDVRENP
jgi:hypothetical protein